MDIPEVSIPEVLGGNWIPGSPMVVNPPESVEVPKIDIPLGLQHIKYRLIPICLDIKRATQDFELISEYQDFEYKPCNIELYEGKELNDAESS